MVRTSEAIEQLGKPPPQQAGKQKGTRKNRSKRNMRGLRLALTHWVRLGFYANPFGTPRRNIHRDWFPRP